MIATDNNVLSLGCSWNGLHVPYRENTVKFWGNLEQICKEYYIFAVKRMRYTVLQYSISYLFHSKDIREALIPLPDDDLLHNQKGTIFLIETPVSMLEVLFIL